MVTDVIGWVSSHSSKDCSGKMLVVMHLSILVKVKAKVVVRANSSSVVY